MEPHIIILINAIILIFILFVFIANLRKSAKLEKAMNHYNTVNSPQVIKKDYVVSTVNFEKQYVKSVGLPELMKGHRREEYLKYYMIEIVNELNKNEAIEFEIIEGEDTDTIKGELKYLVRV